MIIVGDTKFAFDPTVSAAQHRLMEAAAHTPGGYGGVSQKVGKEFVGKDEEPKASVRKIDKDGHLSIESNPISKANICEYVGKEIPDFESLGLDPNKLYKLLRDPEELAKGAGTFAGKPIMLIHKPINAMDHPREAVVGSVGTDVNFDAPYLKAPLTIWDGEAIQLIDTDQQKELSSAYRYRADMTPGKYEGENYDGVMRDIVGNHVALVKEGRAGSDVVVGDTMENVLMSKKLLSRKAAMAQGALLVFLQPKLAQDAKLDLSPLLEGVTAKNFKDKKASILDGIKKGAKLAQDASLDDLTGLLDKLETVDTTDDELEPNAGVPPKLEEKKPGMDDDVMAKIRELLKSKGIDDEDIAAIEAMMSAKPEAPAVDADPEKKPDFMKPKAEDEEKKDMVSKEEMKTAMDAAVKQATKDAMKLANDIRAAEEDVRPYIGKIAMAHDSAEAVYRTALTTMKVDINGVHPSALKAVLKAQPVPDEKKNKIPIAMDAAGADDFHKRYPDASRIGSL